MSKWRTIFKKEPRERQQDSLDIATLGRPARWWTEPEAILLVQRILASAWLGTWAIFLWLLFAAHYDLLLSFYIAVIGFFVLAFAFMTIASLIRAVREAAHGPSYWRCSFSIWWLLQWRGMTGAAVITLAVNFGIYGSVGPPSDLQNSRGAIFQLLVLIFVLAWSVTVVRMALVKKYHHFRIVVIAKPPHPQAAPEGRIPQALHLTWSRVARFWWAIVWRQVIWALAFLLVLLAIGLGIDLDQGTNISAGRLITSSLAHIGFYVLCVTSLIMQLFIINMAKAEKFPGFKFVIAPGNLPKKVPQPPPSANEADQKGDSEPPQR